MADSRVEAAIANWAPRFVSQGVDYNDFAGTTARIDRWEDWLPAWSETAALHSGLGAEAAALGNRLTAGEAYVRAALCYHFAKFVWLVDLDLHRRTTELAISSLYQAHRHLDPVAERVMIPFEGSPLAGNLRRPAGGRAAPLVVLIPGLDSTKEEFFNWENVFLGRGMATFSLDGPGQGESGFQTRIRPDYEVAVAAGLEALAGRDDIDLDQVGLVGVSLGGYYAPRAAAFEPRVSAVATVGGVYDFGACWDGLPQITRETFRHHSGSADEEEARAAAGRLSLAGVAEQIEQPLLVVFGKLDRLIPFGQAERLAREAQHAELVMYPNGNHVCNNLPYRYRPLVGDWMAGRLGVGQP